MSEMVARCGGTVVYTKPVVEIKVKEVFKSRWTGDLEESRRTLVSKMVDWIFPGVVMTKLTLAVGKHTFAAGTAQAVAGTVGAEGIRRGFEQLLDVFTAIAEPILWFYALTACILMATKSKQAGWDRLKQVAYAYAGITLLPTFFAFIRYIAVIIKESIHF